MTQPEYYSNGKRMSPTKLMYNIKQKVDDQIKESNGTKPRNEESQGGVANNSNFRRFNEDYLQSPREYVEPLKEVGMGSYTRNLQIVNKML